MICGSYDRFAAVLENGGIVTWGQEDLENDNSSAQDWWDEDVCWLIWLKVVEFTIQSGSFCKDKNEERWSSQTFVFVVNAALTFLHGMLHAICTLDHVKWINRRTNYGIQ